MKKIPVSCCKRCSKIDKRYKKSLCHSCYNTTWVKRTKKSHEQEKLRLKIYYKLNKEIIKARVKLWAQQNRDKVRQHRRNWAKRYPEKNAEKQRKRIQKLIERTPKWANVEAIKQFYKNCPKGYHVDHIIPLNGKIVSGLHVLENLQYLPAVDNLKKHNNFKEL
jgi:hypothetical protein